MDEFVVKTLQKWNLGDLVERFRDEEVNEEAFSVLTPDIIKELIPKLGKRAIFNARYAEFKQTFEQESSPPPPLPPSIPRDNAPPVVDQPLAPPILYPIPSAYTSVVPKDQQCSSAQSFETYFLQQLKPQNSQEHDEPRPEPAPLNDSFGLNIDDEPTIKRIKLEIYEGEELSKSGQEEDGFDGQEESYAEESLLTEEDSGFKDGTARLRTLLGQSPLTKELLETENLNKSQRILLTNTVVQYLMSSSKDGRVSTKTFRYWRDVILYLWPTQAMTDYFKRGNGRLLDRYHYIIRARKEEITRLREQRLFASAMDNVVAAAAAASSAGEGSSSAQRSEDSWDGQDSTGEGVGGYEIMRLDVPAEEEEQTVAELRSIISRILSLKDTLKVQFLTPNQRNTLSSAIVEHLMDKNGGPITIDEMVTYAQAIERIYPNENASIYLRRACNRSRVNGKLFDRYSYVKRKNSINRGKAWDDFLDERTTYGQLREIQDLDQARQLWTETLKVRQEMTRKFSPGKILDSFPFLKQPEGYKLLLEDFDRELPEMRTTFQEHWPQTATSIYRHVLDTNFLVGISEFSVEDFQTDIVTSCLIILPLLFRLSKRNEKKWNPSRLDVCHNFILYAREFREAVDALKRRQQQLEHYKRRINPVVVAIGPTISTIEVTYIVIQDTFYRFESLPEAVELCLKIGAALGVRYLEEVSAPWYFVQRFVMKLELPSDFINSRVFTVVEALNLPMR